MHAGSGKVDCSSWKILSHFGRVEKLSIEREGPPWKNMRIAETTEVIFGKDTNVQ